MGSEKLQLQKLKKAGIDTSLLSKIIVAGDDKTLAYKKIIKELKMNSSEVIVCGDRINNDLAPAKKMGCTTVHMKYGRGSSFEKDENIDFQIKELNSILEIINKKVGF
jgi:FMN phosphatase YigB (HAD superfamily)